MKDCYGGYSSLSCKNKKKIAVVSEERIALLEMEINTFLSFNIKHEIPLVIAKPVTNSNKTVLFYLTLATVLQVVSHAAIRCIGYNVK